MATWKPPVLGRCWRFAAGSKDQPATSRLNGSRVDVPIFLRLVEKVDDAIKAGVIRNDLGSPLLVAQVLWASMHGLVAALIARPRPHFPWENVDDLIQVQTNMLLDGMLVHS
jgi:hypothetical protein